MRFSSLNSEGTSKRRMKNAKVQSGMQFRLQVLQGHREGAEILRKMQEQASGSGALAGFVSVLSASRKVLRKARPTDLFGHSLPDTLR